MQEMSWNEYNDDYSLSQIFDSDGFDDRFDIDETKESNEDIFEKKYNGSRSNYMW